MYDLDEVDAPEDAVDEVPEFMKPENDEDKGPEGNEADVDRRQTIAKPRRRVGARPALDVAPSFIIS